MSASCLAGRLRVQPVALALALRCAVRCVALRIIMMMVMMVMVMPPSPPCHAASPLPAARSVQRACAH